MAWRCEVAPKSLGISPWIDQQSRKRRLEATVHQCPESGPQAEAHGHIVISGGTVQWGEELVSMLFSKARNVPSSEKPKALPQNLLRMKMQFNAQSQG